MAIMNSKERKARNRGRKQGYIQAIDELTDYIIEQRNTKECFDMSDLLADMQKMKSKIKDAKYEIKIKKMEE